MVLNKTDKGGFFIIRTPISWTEKTLWASEESPHVVEQRTRYGRKQTAAYHHHRLKVQRRSHCSQGKASTASSLAGLPAPAAHSDAHHSTRSPQPWKYYMYNTLDTIFYGTIFFESITSKRQWPPTTKRKLKTSQYENSFNNLIYPFSILSVFGAVPPIDKSLFHLENPYPTKNVAFC